ncbi:hypothetical protein DRQ53_01170 [bacterium]|nr:MAG: hypothetical protein DRQ53_01170 [bacterium]
MSGHQQLERELARLTERFEEQPAGRVFAPLADCHRKLGQLDTALQVCLTGLARHPGYSSAQLILGKIFLDRGEDDPAREALQAVLDLDSQNLLAMRLLAEMAERLGDLDEAELRWRQLAACEYDPELTEERLEAIALEREGGAPDEAEDFDNSDSADDEDAPEATDDRDAGTAIEQEPDQISAGNDESAPADKGAPAEPASTAGAASEAAANTSDIATLTLAGIYAEQGFRAKALEIYKAIQSRNPQMPGLEQKIEAVESAMNRARSDVAPDAVRRVPQKSGGLEVVASTATPVSEAVPAALEHGEPLFSDVPSFADPVGDDASRYRRFGSWLGRVKPDDED